MFRLSRKGFKLSYSAHMKLGLNELQYIFITRDNLHSLQHVYNLYWHLKYEPLIEFIHIKIKSFYSG